MPTEVATGIALSPQRHFYQGPRTLSIMPTFTCPAACSDCGTLSSPRERARLEIHHIISALDKARELGFRNVVFTGGEATLRWKDLLLGIRHARSLDFPVRLVTNAYWARNLEAARKKLEALIAAGLSEINYSTGDEHVKFVPIERVACAVRAACERALPVHVMIELKSDNSVTREKFLNHPMVAQLSAEECKHLSVKTSPWMPMDHSATYSYPPENAVNRYNVGMRPGCDSVLQTYTIQADGRVGACCGLGMRTVPELNVGHVGRQGALRRAITDSEADFLKLWIHYEGPERIIAWASRHNPDIKWEDRYAHHCQFCLRLYHDDDVRQVVRDHWEEVISMVLQSAWLDEVYVPQAVAGFLK
ncbi:radical SAM protein [Streptomyces sp. NPDC001678]|uniref:radical SAM protein n=1 Tax=Streptomyces sp. NPDC001678 TaxID=3364599 RepID=UPI00369473AB